MIAAIAVAAGSAVTCMVTVALPTLFG